VNNYAQYDTKSQRLLCQGEWNLASLSLIEHQLPQIAWPKQGTIAIDGKNISIMDSAGAWLLISQIKKLKKQSLDIKLENFSKQQLTLIDIVEHRAADLSTIPKKSLLNWIERVGKNSYDTFNEFQKYLAFIGQITVESLRIIRHPSHHIRWNAFASTIESTGFNALPIIALLSFMIGIVITYQMGLQLKNYGANIYIVDLLGLAVLREFGPLLTAIMVAGRTGSAFTAQLGIMKINQEIDALDTMGVTPTELLLIPRIIGLVIALPLLTMWADIFGVLGGMVMSNSMLGINWYDFLHRFQLQIPLKTLIIGLGKTPVFAIIIASIGCFQGMQVEGSSESIGKNTTRSVVLGIFFIILADAAFSILFSKLKL
jgi:phospholipid/cholesterol/gamma-HCH transport system permease protein